MSHENRRLQFYFWTPLGELKANSVVSTLNCVYENRQRCGCVGLPASLVEYDRAMKQVAPKVEICSIFLEGSEGF